MQAMEDKLIIRPLSSSSVSSTGALLLPHLEEDVDPNQGIIISVGPGYYDGDKKKYFSTDGFSVGEHVYFRQRSGNTFHHEGEDLLMIRARYITGKIKTCV